ncbi:MAG: signal peptide peptidase SppA [Filomicrobium sp.]
MSLDVDTLLDRRRMRRKVTFWRALAVIVALVAVGVALTAGNERAGFLAPSQIARISITGTITENREQLKMLDKIEQADHVQALIVYVNSPGGTTTGGEAIYDGLRRIAAKKPVVAQFGTVAASAGYIVGLGTDYIVTRGNTITGSVGVIVQWPEVTDLLDKIGVKMNTVKSGSLKAEPNPFIKANPEALEVTSEMIADGFDWFHGLVETRRGIKVSDVPGLREGRVFSGRQAKTYKLVDAVGGEREVRDWLENERGVEGQLKIVDWHPQQPGAWGVSAFATEMARSMARGAASGIGEAVQSTTGLSSLSLDGLLAVWQPPEN